MRKRYSEITMKVYPIIIGKGYHGMHSSFKVKNLVTGTETGFMDFDSAKQCADKLECNGFNKEQKTKWEKKHGK